MIESLVKEKLAATEPRTDVKQRARKQPGRKPRSLSPAKRAFVFKNAGSKCENCGSRRSLQIDHRLPVAKGGGNSVDNLRVLCRSCNQRAAIEQLGLEAMDPHLNHVWPQPKLPRRRHSIRTKIADFCPDNIAK